MSSLLDHERAYSPRQGGQYLGASHAAVRRWAREGLIDHLDVGGGRIRLSPAALRAFAEAHPDRLRRAAAVQAGLRRAREARVRQ